MHITSRQNADGSFEMITTLTAAELEQVRSEAEAMQGVEAGIKPMFLGIDFSRKTDYCVTCNDGHQHYIWAYGDIHAFAIAVSKCGAGFAMTKGKCRS